MEGAVSKRRKTYVVTHRNDEDRHAYIFVSRRASSVSPRLRHSRQLALLFCPNLTLNLYTLYFALPLAFLPHLPPLLTSLTVPLSGSPLRSLSITRDSTFLSLSQRPCIAKPEATFQSSTQPCALRSLTRPSALPSFSLNFLRLPSIFLRSMTLAQKKLTIAC